MWYLLYPIESSDVVQGINTRAQTTMEAEDLILDEGGQRQKVEEVGEVLPDVRITIFSKALIVEAVNLSDLTGLVVAAEDGDARRVANFEGDKKGDGFDAVVTTIDIVALLELGRGDMPKHNIFTYP